MNTPIKTLTLEEKMDLVLSTCSQINLSMMKTNRRMIMTVINNKPNIEDFIIRRTLDGDEYDSLAYGTALKKYEADLKEIGEDYPEYLV